MKKFFKRFFPILGPFWVILISLIITYLIGLMAMFFLHVTIDWMWVLLALPALCMVAFVARDIINSGRRKP